MNLWKIIRDPIYGPLFHKIGMKGVREAGFIFDSDPDDASLEDVDWLCTPVEKIQKNVLDSDEGTSVVLLSTGSLAPIHRGHIQIMEDARIFFEKKGVRVVGGYLSPGHEEYIDEKLGAPALSAPHRLWLCAKALETSDWLMLDPWEALSRKVAVNFTDVYCRLEGYLHRHVSGDIRLIYVCGGDNARFSLSFLEHGSCAVVNRPESEHEFEKYKQHTLLRDNPSIFFVNGDDEASSTRVRRGAYHLLPHGICHTDLVERVVEHFALRKDLASHVVSHWEMMDERWSIFQDEICALFEAFVEGDITCRTASYKRYDSTCISLEPFPRSEHILEICRVFSLGGYSMIGHDARPGTLSLVEQIEKIPSGAYDIVDDDQMTGNTQRMVLSILPERICIRVVHVSQQGEYPKREIVDCRDFLFGGRYSGLVVDFPQGIRARMPYVLPYVDPYVRSGIPPWKVLSFSLAVWDSNIRFFEGTDLLVSSLSDGLQEVCMQMGFEDDVRLEDVAIWHKKRLESFVR
jgi:nicotinic acid mononucleotide adenylyltransferase